MEHRYEDLAGMFPRPGKALKVVLGLIVALSLTNYVLVNWVPNGKVVFEALVCTTDDVIGRLGLWRLLSAGFLTLPSGPGALNHLLFTLIGLYFLSPDLERRWGPWRFLRFLAFATVFGFGLAIAIDLAAPPSLAIFHPRVMFGADAALTATTVAWSLQNADRQVRLFFVLPVRGKWLFWLAAAYCLLAIVAWDSQMTSGVVVPIGGLVTGLLLGGSPSVVRSIYLRARLAILRKEAAGVTSRSRIPRPARSTREGGPPLRVVYGGLEDELKKRKPPKDKRDLN